MWHLLRKRAESYAAFLNRQIRQCYPFRLAPMAKFARWLQSYAAIQRPLQRPEQPASSGLYVPIAGCNLPHKRLPRNAYNGRTHAVVPPPTADGGWENDPLWALLITSPPCSSIFTAAVTTSSAVLRSCAVLRAITKYRNSPDAHDQAFCYCSLNRDCR